MNEENPFCCPCHLFPSFLRFSQLASATSRAGAHWHWLVSASLLTNFFADFSTAQLLFHYFVVCLLDAWCTQLSAQLLHSALHSLCRLINHLTAEQLSSTSTFFSSTLLAHLAGTLISSHLDSSAEWSSLGVLSLTDCLSVWFCSLAAHCVFPISSLILVLCTVWQATHSNWASAASTITACYNYYCLIRLQLLSSHTHTLSDVSISSVPFASCLSRSQSFFVCDSFSLSSSVASQFVSRLSVCAPAASLCYTCTADSFLSLFSLFSSLFPFFLYFHWYLQLRLHHFAFYSLSHWQTVQTGVQCVLSALSMMVDWWPPRLSRRSLLPVNRADLFFVPFSFFLFEVI